MRDRNSGHSVERYLTRAQKLTGSQLSRRHWLKILL